MVICNQNVFTISHLVFGLNFFYFRMAIFYFDIQNKNNLLNVVCVQYTRSNRRILIKKGFKVRSNACTNSK